MLMLLFHLLLILILVLLFPHQCADLVFDLSVQIFEDLTHEVTIGA